jgi:hypothetical protein
MNSLEQINIKYWELLFGGADLGRSTTKDYSAKCPVCGDSKKNKRMKRCHLFTKNDWDHDKVHCFNCGWMGNMFSLLETVSPSLYNAYKNERRGQSFSDLIKTKEPEKEKEIEVKIDVSVFDNLRESPYELFDLPPQFKEIEVGDEYYDYLKSRKMTDDIISMFRKCNDKIVYQGNEMLLEKYLIIPLWCGNKVYGYQARSIRDKQFYTFIPDENSGYKVWNWFKLDMNKTIYVFESYFDALSSGLDNVCAQLGATLSVDRIKEGKENIVFVLDNQRVDPTAKTETIKYIKQGHRVMVWPNKNIKFKDFNEILKSGGNRERISHFIKTNIDDGITAEISLKV